MGLICISFLIQTWGWVKTLAPSEPQVIAGLKWMFIPLKNGIFICSIPTFVAELDFAVRSVSSFLDFFKTATAQIPQ